MRPTILWVSVAAFAPSCSPPPCTQFSCPLTEVCNGDGRCVPPAPLPPEEPGGEGEGEGGVVDNHPRAHIRIKSINGIANTSTTAPPIAPLDDVILSGDGSTGGVTGYTWSIAQAPLDSAMRLSSPALVDTGFEFDSAAGVVHGIDVAGVFTIKLTVTTGDSSATDSITLDAVPTQGLHLQLTWTAEHDDIDLHLANTNPPNFCQSPNDCFYEDCQGGGPDWDNSGGPSDGDPSLDIDDVDGFGPENINIVKPVAGSYTVAVHAFAATGTTDGVFIPTDVEVKAFAGGVLLDTFTGHLSQVNDFWTVAVLNVGTTVTVTNLNSLTTISGCP